MYNEIPPKQPRLLTIPTVFLSLVTAQIGQGILGPLDLGPILSSLLFLIALAIPVALKWVMTLDDLYQPDPRNQLPVSRLPTSRFPTVPGRPSTYPRGTLPQFNN